MLVTIIKLLFCDKKIMNSNHENSLKTEKYLHKISDLAQHMMSKFDNSPVVVHEPLEISKFAPHFFTPGYI